MEHAITRPAAVTAGNESTALEYAPARRRGRVGRIVRWALLGVFLGAVGCAVYWRGPLWDWGRLHWAQGQCARYAFPADRPAASTADARQGTPAAVPAPLATVEAMTPGATARWRSPGFAERVVFLHRRVSPAGRERLVVVRCIPMYLASAHVTQALEAVVIEPAPLWPIDGRPKAHVGKWSGGYPVMNDVSLTGGQPDLSDASKFSFAYTIDGRPGRVDAKLNDDDTVTFAIGEGSATIFPRTRAP